MTVKNSILASSKWNHGINIGKKPEELKIEMKNKFKARRLNYILQPIQPGIDSYHKLLHELLCKTEINETIVDIYIEEEKFDQGVQSSVFRIVEGRDDKKKRKLVGKIPIEAGVVSREYARIKTRQLLISSIISRLYRQKLISHERLLNEAIHLQYPLPIIYELMENQNFKGHNYIFAEPSLEKNDSTWQKYGNNLFNISSQNK
ncbi:UNKNOWN [Stylonychia lemnae]|uniref:Alpha-type protein kinase domain-containing protein n=1 Tax=Stylonychia lemnae TaxID=5949 RepID=A0A078A1B9_STYLE|nr:UNKNOWN [Stylonychia lemnae]|eukprot:CDW74574.1 UNKNOWN [Stylonychia lemnae]